MINLVTGGGLVCLVAEVLLQPSRADMAEQAHPDKAKAKPTVVVSP